MSVFLAEKQNRYGIYYSLDIKRSLHLFLTDNKIIIEAKNFLIDFIICNRIIATNFIKEIIKQCLTNCKISFLKTSLLIKGAVPVKNFF